MNRDTSTERKSMSHIAVIESDDYKEIAELKRDPIIKEMAASLLQHGQTPDEPNMMMAALHEYNRRGGKAGFSIGGPARALKVVYDEMVDHRRRKQDGAAVGAMLAMLTEGSTFELKGTGRAYDATYRKNSVGSWDQVRAAESPLVVNMDAEHLGFCVGYDAVVKALSDSLVRA
jgi:hypothetical protein